MFFLLLQAALAADIPVPLDQLPEAVRAAVLQRYPGATLLEAEREGSVYDVELRTPEGERWEVEVTRDGRIREVERQADGKGDPEEDEGEKGHKGDKDDKDDKDDD